MLKPFLHLILMNESKEVKKPWDQSYDTMLKENRTRVTKIFLLVKVCHFSFGGYDYDAGCCLTRSTKMRLTETLCAFHEVYSHFNITFSPSRIQSLNPKKKKEILTFGHIQTTSCGQPSSCQS